jgi:hypothetical protein
MKTSSMIRSLAILVAMIGMRISEASAASPPPMYGVSFQVFYNELSPYGDWVMDPQFGYVWVPFVDAGFQPYLTNGYWAMTEFGNTWVSNYAWGWAPFHYGRWFWNNFYGWAWVPDYEWGPAWVSWRTGGGYYGWAPLAPGFSINVGFYAPTAHWVFIPQKRFRHPHFHRYCVPNYHVGMIYNRTTVINNTYVYNNQTFYTGPSRREVERVTNSRVPVYQVRESSRPGRTVVQQNSLNVYRPEVKSVRNSNDEARPSRSFTAEEYQERKQSGRSISESRGASQPRQYENQRNSGIGNDNENIQRGANNDVRMGTPRQAANSPNYGNRESSAPRTSQGRENTPAFEAPQRRQESTPNYSKPAQSRETQARPESRTQNAQQRQQPQSTPARQQPQVEQRRNSAPNQSVYSGNQNGRQTQQNPPTQRGNSGSERSASESRGSKRGVN